MNEEPTDPGILMKIAGWFLAVIGFFGIIASFMAFSDRDSSASEIFAGALVSLIGGMAIASLGAIVEKLTRIEYHLRPATKSEQAETEQRAA